MNFAFCDSVLSIETPGAKMRLRWRPEPVAEELPAGGTRWKPFCPEFRLIKPAGVASDRGEGPNVPHPANVPGQEAKAAAFAAFHQEIPEAITGAVGRFQSHQWLLMLLRVFWGRISTFNILVRASSWLYAGGDSSWRECAHAEWQPRQPRSPGRRPGGQVPAA